MTRRTVRAFTLIELLVVVALIAFLTGALGLALRHPGEAVALQAAQDTIAGLCRAARGRAVLTRLNARLVVAADPADAEGYLRYVQVVHEDGVGSNRWRAEGAGVWLPRGVYLVPSPPTAVPGQPAWPASRRSTALSSAAQTLTINGVAAGTFYYVQFTPRGTTRDGGLVLTTGRAADGVSGPALVFDNPDNVRGVLLRSSGTLTLLEDAGAFAP
ncbi:MAG: prepilin-type N-terminal cleavage/methylation domain-containing protein [Opitutaceae bacterium]|nr:prepilin-type N-terminal cleavage/methylation domain-containing protein [Opitutaceae bacterium]